ncbi:MAG: NAD-dependent epimerase/dehydratase family protein [Prevotella sp.]|jgi:nucleoside-diphosphate-sugar epimerase
MRILITGPHGFVGTNLIEALWQDNEIYGLSHSKGSLPQVREMYDWEDLNSGAIPEVDAIIHLAGKAHDTKNQTEARVYFDVNTGLTKQIYDYFVHSKAQKFIFFSSVKAAADKVEGDILTEEQPAKPVGPYGESKIEAEKYILSHPTEKDVYILRPCMIHGPGNKGNLNLLYKVVSKGLPWPLGAFENRRSFLSIDNLSYIISQLLRNPIPSGIYQVSDDEALSTNELISIICETLGRKAHIWHCNRSLMALLARIGDWCHLPLNSERLRKLTENYVVSNEKIKKIGIGQLPVRAKDGLMKTIRSFDNE